jgi:hypothetical protein
MASREASLGSGRGASRRRRRRKANILVGGGKAHPRNRPKTDSSRECLGQAEPSLPHRLAAARR